jgi:hypothetical protein
MDSKEQLHYGGRDIISAITCWLMHQFNIQNVRTSPRFMPTPIIPPTLTPNPNCISPTNGCSGSKVRYDGLQHLELQLLQTDLLIFILTASLLHQWCCCCLRSISTPPDHAEHWCEQSMGRKWIFKVRSTF